MIVIDASVALAWCFADEESVAADRALDRVGTDGAVAPAIWPLEVANGVCSAERRGRITLADASRLRELLASLPVEVEPIDVSTALGEVSELARRFDLSAYDAAYLALAARRGLPLATADQRLARTARLAGVEVVS